MKKTILLFLFISVNLFLLILNFELFFTVVNVDLGFNVVSVAPILLVQILGLIFIILYFLLVKNMEENHELTIELLEDKRMLLEKDLEIMTLKQQVQSEASSDQTEVEPENSTDIN